LTKSDGRMDSLGFRKLGGKVRRQEKGGKLGAAGYQDERMGGRQTGAKRKNLHGEGGLYMGIRMRKTTNKTRREPSPGKVQERGEIEWTSRKR